MEAQDKAMTPEEIQEMRREVAKELAAEEAGGARKLPETSGAEIKEPEVADQSGDPWAGVNPTLKIMFDNMQAKVSVLDETQTRLKQAESRIGAMSNEFHAAKKAVENLSLAPSKEQMAEAAKSEEEWEQLRGEFPEWADATDKRMNAKIAALRKEFTKGSSGTDKAAEIQQEIAQLKASLKDGTSVEVQKGIVSYFYPDWEKTIANPEYSEWLKSQPEDLRSKIKSDKAVDAVAVLEAFEKSKSTARSVAEIADERKRRIKTAVNPQGGKAVPVKSELDMTEAELRATIGAEVFAN